MQYNYKTAQEIATLLQVTVEYFHRDIKLKIKQDFKSELKKAGIENPDILLSLDNFIRLAHPKDKDNFIDTELKLTDYH
ncbi:hypothetical protein [Flectobacillus longus]|uniref:hypothetical protein n=1 Tax=Flectobacillus longus TaxID=2984207 RepID=UPI0024B6DF0C|nr:hypothetical protein [Flectobacillus longus]MDI9880318.1 hypothetical protein [Flectobacillus longus]